MPFIDSCVPLDLSRTVGLVVNILVHVFSGLILVNVINITDQAARSLALFVSLGALILFVLMTIAKTMSRRKNYISNRIPSYESDITYMSNGIGVLIYTTLSLLLAIVHIKGLPFVAPFDPVLEPAANARLNVIILGYYLSSAVWVAITFFVSATIKGVEDRRHAASDI